MEDIPERPVAAKIGYGDEYVKKRNERRDWYLNRVRIAGPVAQPIIKTVVKEVPVEVVKEVEVIKEVVRPDPEAEKLKARVAELEAELQAKQEPVEPPESLDVQEWEGTTEDNKERRYQELRFLYEQGRLQNGSEEYALFQFLGQNLNK